VDSQKLEGVFVAALSKIDPAKSSGNAKKHIPIFQRNALDTKKQAIREAANALGALWMPDRGKGFGRKSVPSLDGVARRTRLGFCS
jgi:hypothetical protein